MDRIAVWIRVGAEAIAAAMLAAMFCTFLLQIFSRYVMVQPFGWTLELCLVLWVWLVFFGCAFIVRNRDHVTFDILYLAVPDRPRRIFALISALVVAVALAWSFLPTWDWIDFLRIKKSATLKLPMRDIYIIYMVFLGVVSLRFFWQFITILRHGAPREDHEVHVGEEG
jgi:C4-dicarboxylate transporter DctQ subunit